MSYPQNAPVGFYDRAYLHTIVETITGNWNVDIVIQALPQALVDILPPIIDFWDNRILAGLAELSQLSQGVGKVVKFDLGRECQKMMTMYPISDIGQEHCIGVVEVVLNRWQFSKSTGELVSEEFLPPGWDVQGQVTAPLPVDFQGLSAHILASSVTLIHFLQVQKLKTFPWAPSESVLRPLRPFLSHFALLTLCFFTGSSYQVRCKRNFWKSIQWIPVLCTPKIERWIKLSSFRVLNFSGPGLLDT